jgi:hypothetical protein
MKRLLVAMLLLLAGPAHAQESLFTGNGYLKACTADDPVSRAVCMQYTLGMGNMLLSLQLSGLTRALECSPGESTGRQKKDLLVKYLQDNPQVRHFPTPQIYLAVLEQVWPCSAGGVLPPVEKKM